MTNRPFAVTNGNACPDPAVRHGNPATRHCPIAQGSLPAQPQGADWRKNAGSA